MAAYELSCNLILFFAKVYQSELNSMDDAASEIIQPGMTEENCFLETFEVLFISFTMQMYDPIIFFVVSVVRKMKMSTTACTWRMIRWQRKIFEYRVRNTIDYLVACVLNNSEGIFFYPSHLFQYLYLRFMLHFWRCLYKEAFCTIAKDKNVGGYWYWCLKVIHNDDFQMISWKSCIINIDVSICDIFAVNTVNSTIRK